MNKRILPGIAVMLAGCQTAPMTSSESFDPKVAGREWADAYNACDVDALAKLYHPRAHLWLAPSRTPATTPEAIRAAFRADCAPGAPRRSITITPTSVQDFGDTARGAGTAQV